MSLSDFPVSYELIGGSLYTDLSQHSVLSAIYSSRLSLNYAPLCGIV